MLFHCKVYVSRLDGAYPHVVGSNGGRPPNPVKRWCGDVVLYSTAF